MNKLERVARAISTAEHDSPVYWPRWVKAAQAAIDAMRPQWQPIETAPKDSTVVDIWRGAWNERAVDMIREDLGNGNVFYSPVYFGPSCVRDATHWMPLPKAP